jgi:hypothetical protein
MWSGESYFRCTSFSVKVTFCISLRLVPIMRVQSKLSVIQTWEQGTDIGRLCNKRKSKAVPQLDSDAKLLLILYLGTRWRWVVTPWPRFSPGKGLPVPIGQEAVWTTEQVWTQRLEEKSFRLCWGSNLDRPVVQSVARHYTDWATPASTDIG